MLIIPVKNSKDLERALKKLKNKARDTGLVKEIRNRMEYKKPSVVKREMIQKAIYVNKRRIDLEN